MQTTIQHQVLSHSGIKNQTGLWKRFIKWADKQEKNRFGWTASIIAGHGCIATIITAMFIVLSGNSFILWPITIGAMAACLITNLSAMPTKIIIPVFFISLLVDIVVIAVCISYGIDFNSTNI